MAIVIPFRKNLQNLVREMQQEDAELSKEIDDLIDMAVTSWLKEQDQDQLVGV